MNDATAREHFRRIEAVLGTAQRRAFHGRERCSHTGDRVDYRTPLDALMEREDAQESEAAVNAVEACQVAFCVEELPETLRKIIESAAVDAFRQCEEMWMEWFFEDGPNPLQVMSRVFLYAKMKKASLIWNMPFRELGPLFDVRHATMFERCKALFGDVPAGWKKPNGARLKMSEAQKGNQNRKGGAINGHASPARQRSFLKKLHVPKKARGKHPTSNTQHPTSNE